MPGGRNTLGTCNVSVYILGTKQRVLSSKNSVFHWVPPPGEMLGGIISSPFGWRSVRPLCLLCEGVPPARMCCGPAGLPSGEKVSWQRCAAVMATTQSAHFLALRVILSTGCSKSQIKQAWAELDSCSSLRMFRHVPRGRPYALGCVFASTA